MSVAAATNGTRAAPAFAHADAAIDASAAPRAAPPSLAALDGRLGGARRPAKAVSDAGAPSSAKRHAACRGPARIAVEMLVSPTQPSASPWAKAAAPDDTDSDDDAPPLPARRALLW